jgi:hypothetical protein
MRVESPDTFSLLELRAIVAQRLQAYGAFEGCSAEAQRTILAQACMVNFGRGLRGARRSWGRGGLQMGSGATISVGGLPFGEGDLRAPGGLGYLPLSER